MIQCTPFHECFFLSTGLQDNCISHSLQGQAVLCIFFSFFTLWLTRKSSRLWSTPPCQYHCDQNEGVFCWPLKAYPQASSVFVFVFAWEKGGWALEKTIFGDRNGVDMQVSRKTCPPKPQEKYPRIVSEDVLKGQLFLLTTLVGCLHVLSVLSQDAFLSIDWELWFRLPIWNTDNALSA